MSQVHLLNRLHHVEPLDFLQAVELFGGMSMVAELAPGSTASRPINRPGYRNGEIPILTKLRARNLYLYESLPYKGISELTGLPIRVLEQLAFRERWVSIKRANKERLTKAADARQGAMHEEIVETIAGMSEQHAIRGLQRAGEALEREDKEAARDFQSYSGGVKNFVAVARAIRDQAGGPALNSAQITNVFFMQLEPPLPSEAKPDKTVIEV